MEWPMDSQGSPRFRLISITPLLEQITNKITENNRPNNEIANLMACRHSSLAILRSSLRTFPSNPIFLYSLLRIHETIESQLSSTFTAVKEFHRRLAEDFT